MAKPFDVRYMYQKLNSHCNSSMRWVCSMCTVFKGCQMRSFHLSNGLQRNIFHSNIWINGITFNLYTYSVDFTGRRGGGGGGWLLRGSSNLKLMGSAKRLLSDSGYIQCSHYYFILFFIYFPFRSLFVNDIFFGNFNLSTISMSWMHFQSK